MAEKNKCTKKQRTPRVVPTSERKDLKRTGGGKPQERRITSTVKVRAIQETVFKLAKEHVILLGVALTEDIAEHLRWLCTLTNETPIPDYILNPTDEDDRDATVFDLMMLVMADTAAKAFYAGCKLVPDSEFAYVDDDWLAVRGRQMGFFLALQVKEKAQAAEVAKHRQQSRNRRNHVGNQLGTAGRSNGHTANVAQRVAQASGLR